MELVPAVGSWSPFLYSIKASIISLTPLSRSGRRGVRIESVRAVTAEPVLRARRIASVVPDSMLRIR